MLAQHVEPLSPNLDAMMSGPPPEQTDTPRRSFRARVSDTIQRARGRSSPSPAPPAHESQHDTPSPSKTRGMGRFLRKSIDIARSSSPSPSRNKDVVYSYTAPAYEVPDLPDWQLYDGTSVPMNLDQLAKENDSLMPPPPSLGYHGAPQDGLNAVSSPVPPAHVHRGSLGVMPPPPPQPQFLPHPPSMIPPQRPMSMPPQLPPQLPPNMPPNMQPSMPWTGHEAGSSYAQEPGMQPPEEPLFGHVAPRSRSARVSLPPTLTASPPPRPSFATPSPAPPALPEESHARSPERPPCPVVPALQVTSSAPEDTAGEVSLVNAYADVTDGGTQDETVIDHRSPKERAGTPSVLGQASSRGSCDLETIELEDNVDTQGRHLGPNDAAMEEQKQQRILSAMEKAPEGAGLTDLMNRVVNPNRQSWLHGLWPRHASGGSEASKPASDRSSSQGGVIFRGADASPSIYSSESMDEMPERASVASPRTDRSASGPGDAPASDLYRAGPGLLRKNTAQSRRSCGSQSSRNSSQPSDDEREAFERRRRSNLQARHILEAEKKLGMSTELQQAAWMPPAPMPPPPPAPTSPAPSMQSYRAQSRLSAGPGGTAVLNQMNSQTHEAAQANWQAQWQVHPASQEPTCADAPTQTPTYEGMRQQGVSEPHLQEDAQPAWQPTQQVYPDAAAQGALNVQSQEQAYAQWQLQWNVHPEAAPQAPSEPVTQEQAQAAWEAEWQVHPESVQSGATRGPVPNQAQADWYAQWQGHPDAQWQGHPDAQWQGHPDVQWQGYPDAQWQGHPDAQWQRHPDAQWQGHPHVQWQVPPQAHVGVLAAPGMSPNEGVMPTHAAMPHVRRKAPPGSQPSHLPKPASPTPTSTFQRDSMPPPKKSAGAPILPDVVEDDESIIDEQGRRLKPDGFGGLQPVDDQSKEEAAIAPSPTMAPGAEAAAPVASQDTPRAPQVESMRTDFKPQNGRPPSSLSVHTPFVHNASSPRPSSPAVRSSAMPSRKSMPASSSNGPPYQIAPELYTTPQSLHNKIGRMTWTPEVAEAAAKYIQTMTNSASRSQIHQHAKPHTGASRSPLPGAPEPLPPLKTDSDRDNGAPAVASPLPPVPVLTSMHSPVPVDAQTGSSGLPASRSVVVQLNEKGVDLVLNPGEGAQLDDMPLRDALKEAMMRFYFYERHSIPLLRELDKRLVAMEHWSILDPDADAEQPAWNKDAVARVSSEVRREVRALMQGVKMLNETRMHIQELANQSHVDRKRKRPLSSAEPQKRVASESSYASSSRVSSGSSTTSASSSGTVHVHASSAPPSQTRMSSPPSPSIAPLSPMPTPRPSLPVPPSHRVGPRPCPPSPSRTPRPSLPDPPGSRPERVSVSDPDLANETGPSVYDDREAESVAESEAQSDADELIQSESPTERDDREAAIPVSDANASDADADVDAAAPTSSSNSEPGRSTPAKTRNTLDTPVPSLSRPERVKSPLLASLERAEQRSRTPPPPPPPSLHPEDHAEHEKNSNTRVSIMEQDKEQNKENTTGHSDNPKKSDDKPEPQREPFAQVGNHVSSSIPSSGLRARAQKYLQTVERSTSGQVESSPSAADALSTHALKRANTYQPSALSESLRRRMARIESAN